MTSANFLFYETREAETCERWQSPSTIMTKLGRSARIHQITRLFIVWQGHCGGYIVSYAGDFPSYYDARHWQTFKREDSIVVVVVIRHQNIWNYYSLYFNRWSSVRILNWVVIIIAESVDRIKSASLTKSNKFLSKIPDEVGYNNFLKYAFYVLSDNFQSRLLYEVFRNWETLLWYHSEIIILATTSSCEIVISKCSSRLQVLHLFLSVNVPVVPWCCCRWC